MIRGPMDSVHESGSMDPVHILMDPVHGGGPWTRGPWTRGPCFVLSLHIHIVQHVNHTVMFLRKTHIFFLIPLNATPSIAVTVLTGF